MIKLAPSLLAADFARLGEELRIIESAGSNYAHLDVMDGHFVPNITIGPPVIKSLRKTSNLIFDVHLMIENPERYIEAFSSAGADIICFHIESTENPLSLIEKIRTLGKRPAAAINPDTPVERVLPFLSELSMVLVMSVNPGWGGQTFLPDALRKARVLRDYIDLNGFACEIEMDGGITLSNLPRVIEAGVDVVVSGTDIFKAEDIPTRIREFLLVQQKTIRN